jgi:hypothetical protein
MHNGAWHTSLPGSLPAVVRNEFQLLRLHLAVAQVANRHIKEGHLTDRLILSELTVGFSWSEAASSGFTRSPLGGELQGI